MAPLVASFEPVEVVDGETVFNAGDKQDLSVYVVETGVIQRHKGLSDRPGHVSAASDTEHNAGSIFGTSSAINGVPRRDKMVCRGGCRVWRCSRAVGGRAQGAATDKQRAATKST